MLKKFGIKDAKAISTPMGTNGNLDSDASGNMVEDQKMYRSMIGSLLYVCKISSLSKIKSFEGNKENIEVLEAYIKYWIMVS
jgi:hypothetical protein